MTQESKNHIVKVPVIQIRKNWSFYSHYISQALPMHVHNHAFGSGNLLKAIIEGRLEVWCVYQEGKRPGIKGIFTTTFGGDTLVGNKALILYTMTTVEDVTNALLLEGLEFLKRYAKSNGCTQIAAYTVDPEIVKLAQKVGMSVDYTLVLEVNNG